MPEQYSQELGALVGALLQKDPRDRPTTDAILDMPYVRHHLQARPRPHSAVRGS